MNNKYQVFISSTYRDLAREREIALAAVLGLSHMPVGMELFPSTDNDPLRYIKGVIDNCDYYVLLVGGRYGSVDNDGVSYTEKEFDYAVGKGLHIIAFLKGDIESLPPDKLDGEPERKERLDSFRAKVQKGRLARPWTDELHLQGMIYPSLLTAFNDHPRPGWVREDQSAVAQAAYEVRTLSEKCQRLEGELLQLRGNLSILQTEDVAGLDQTFAFVGTFQNKGYSNKYPWKCDATFGDALSIIGPHLMQPRWDFAVNTYLSGYLFKRLGQGVEKEIIRIDDEVFGTFQTQLQALGLISVVPTAYQGTGSLQGTGLAWTLTEQGQSTVLSLRSVKAAPV